MLSWSDIIAHQERYADLLREAERERLVRQVLAGREGRDRFYCRGLTWLGRNLVTWGCRLQARYSAATAVVPASRCQPSPLNR